MLDNHNGENLSSKGQLDSSIVSKGMVVPSFQQPHTYNPTNHIASNLASKGFLNISAVDRGMLVPSVANYPPHYRKRGGGGLAYGYPYKAVDPNAIYINIDWFRKVSKHKMFGVELTDVGEKTINVELIKENASTQNNLKMKNISVELVENTRKPTIKVELADFEIN